MPSLTSPGDYKAAVVSATTGTAKTGTPFVLLRLRTDQGEDCDAYLYLSDKAFERTIKTLHESLGFDGQFETIAKQLPGRRCSLTAEEEYDDAGNSRVRVRWVNPERQPADAAFLARLSERATKLLGLPVKTVVSSPAKTMNVQASAETTNQAFAADPEDDIPF